jgi:hypothetical protein
MSLTDAHEQPLSPIPEPLSVLASNCPPLLTHCPPPATASAEPSADDPLAPYDPLKLRDLRAVDPNVSWLWDGYLARGAVTLLTSLWKAGKTTLIAILLDRLRDGGVLGGRSLLPGRAVVLSEESRDLWRLRADKLAFGDHITWLCRPFRGKPRTKQWLLLIDRLASRAATTGLDLVVIDPLASFLPGPDENSAAAMLKTLAPLQRLTAAGVSILLAHHPSKRSRPHGLASRGSGALPAFVDILIEMDRFDPKNDEDRRRRLHAYSRFERTPIHAILELNAAGNDYLHLGDFHQAECADGWERVRRVLEHAPCKLRRDEMLEDWPTEDLPAPAEITLRRWLDKAVADGKVAREGAGLRNHPHLYWLPGKEVEWPDDPLWWLKEMPDPFDFEKVDKETMRQERRKRGREKAPE